MPIYHGTQQDAAESELARGIALAQWLAASETTTDL